MTIEKLAAEFRDKDMIQTGLNVILSLIACQKDITCHDNDCHDDSENKHTKHISVQDIFDTYMLILGLRHSKTSEKMEKDIKRMINRIINYHLKPDNPDKIPYGDISLISDKLINTFSMDMFVIKIMSMLMSIASCYSTYGSFEELFVDKLDPDNKYSYE